LLDRISLLVLAEFCALAIATHALALLAVASLVPIEGALVEQFRDFVRIEIGLAYLVSD
jgi:hypothetical protein